MRIEVSERWQTTDQSVNLVFNHTEVREAVNITTRYGGGELIERDNLLVKNSNDFVSGDNWVRNETADREFEIVINGRNPDNSLLKV